MDKEILILKRESLILNKEDLLNDLRQYMIALDKENDDSYQIDQVIEWIESGNYDAT